MADEEGRLSFVAGMDDSDFVRGANNIRNEINKTANDVKKTGMTVDEFVSHMQGLVSSFDKLTQSVDKNTKAQETVAEAGKKAATEEKEGADKATKAIRETTKATHELGGAFDGIKGKVAGAMTLASLVAFEKKVIEVRSEMESLQKSFESLAGEHLGRQLYEDIKQFATTTPMMMKDLAKGAQTLLGFNIEAEKIMPILHQIGDISMGDAQKFNSLTLAFAQMSSTGKLMGQDLLQMINAGFNPLVTISEKTGKSISKLKDEMAKGAITVEMVEDAFRTATAEGGKFHNMLEDQSKTMKGALSNLQGAYEEMLNEIGEKQQGVMLKGVELAQTIVQNYEKVGQVLLGLIATYGTYRTAVIAVSMAEGVANGQIVVKIRALRALAAAQALLNKTMLLNPYVLAATALGVLVGSIIAARDGLTDAERAQRDYNKVLEEAKQKQDEYNSKTQEAIRLANDDSAATGERESAMQTLIGRYPEIIKKYIDEKGHLTDILNLKREIAAYDGEMANLDNKTRADMYNKYIQVLEKARRGEQLNETERIMYEGAKKKYNDATPWYTRFGGNYTGGAINYFQQMSKQANYAYKRYGTEQKVSKLMDDMGSMDTKKLESLVVKLQTAEKQIKDHVAVEVKEVGDFIESSDITSLLTKAEGILNARNGNKKELTDAEKKSAAKAAADAAKQDATMRQKLWDNERKEEEEIAAQRLAARNARRQAEIAQIKDDGERKRAEEEYQFQQDIDTIQRQAEEFKKKNLELAREQWEASNKDKQKVWADTDIAKAGWQGQSLTADQDTIIKAQTEQRIAERKRQLEEERKLERQYLYDYMKEYGSIQDQKEAVTKEYDQKISKASTEAQKAMLEKEKEQLLSELDMKELQQDIDWETVFNNLDRQSTKALRALKEKLHTALDAKDITAENAKTIAEKIKEIEDRITNRTDAWASFLPLLKKRKELVEDTARAEQAFQRALGNQTEALGKQMSLQAKAANIIRTQGDERIDTTDITAEKLKEFVKTLDPASEAYKNLTEIAKQLGIAQTDLTAATEEAAKAEAKRNALDTQLKDFKTFKEAFKEGKEKAGGSIEYGLQQATELNELIDTIGLHDTEFGKGVQEFTDGANHFSSAIQKFQSGDFVGAATDAIKGIQDWGSLVERIGGFSFSGSNADEVAEKVGALNKQNEILTGHIDLLTKAIEENAGIRSVEAAEEARKKQEEITSNKMSALYEQMGYHDAHRSNNYYASDEVAAGWNERLNKLFSKHRNDFGTDSVGQVNITQWSDMFNMTAEQWAVIKNYAGDIWEYMTTVGYYDYSDKFDDVVADAGKAYEYTKKIQETLTGMSFDSFRQSFLDALMDTEDDSERFAESVTESYMDSLTKIITQSLINNFVLDSELQEKLNKFYEEYSDIMEEYKNDGDSEKRDRLLSEWRQKVTGELQKTREEAQAIKDAMGYDDIIKEEQFRSDLKSIADNWKSMLTGMETDAEEWGRNVARMMFEDLVERNIMPRLEEDLEHWYRRYQQVMDDISLTDEERAAKLAALQEEYVEMQEDYANATKAIAESLGYDPNNLFAELESSFIDALTDMNADADTWGKNIKQTILKRLIDAFVMDTSLKGRLEELKEQLSEIFSDESLKAMTWEEVVRMATEAVKGMEQDFEKANELVKSFYDALGLNESPFSNLKEDFKNALTDINATAEDFGRKIRESLLKELMQKNVFEVPITVNIEGEEQVFENFDAYSKNWNERYMQAIADNDRQTIDMLMDELMTVYGMTEERAKEYVEQLKKLTKDTTFTGLESSFVSSLMNMEEDAYDFGQQIGKTLAQRIVEQTIATQFIQPLLKKLQDAVDAALNEEGATYSSVIDNGLVKDAIDDITQAYPELQGVVKKIYEMLGISSSNVFGDLRGSLLSVLADMESDAESFGKAIGAKLAEQMLDEYVKATYQADIDSLQKELNDAIGAGDTEKIDAIRKKVEELIAAMGNDENVRKLTEELRRLSDTTFSGMTDSLTSALMDMNTSAKEWGRNIGRTLAEKIIRELIVSRQLQPYLNRIEDAYRKAVSAEGATIESIFAAVTPLIDETIAGMEELSPYIDNVLGKLGLLSTPFDNMRSSFLSNLMDMENDTEDFAADINRILTEAFIDRFVLGDEFDKRLAEWQEQYASIMGGNYSEEERALLLKNLQAAITAAKEGYAEEAQAIHDLMGTGNAKDQTATMNMADKATYDQFETYLGIAVAQQMATLQGNEVRLQILATLQAMTGITSPNGDTVKEIRSMLNTTNEYLLDIKRSNRSILNLCGEKLDTIITRLQGLI